MEPWLIQLLVGMILSTILGFLVKSGSNIIETIKKSVDNINIKINEVLNNQHSQEITITKMEKDIQQSLESNKETREKVSRVREDVKDLQIFAAEVKQWKKDTESFEQFLERQEEKEKRRNNV